VTPADGGGTETPAFYLTAEAPCPYLSGFAERRVLAVLDTPGRAAALPLLIQNGFRRNQTVLYRPQCAACSACLSLRLRLRDFTHDAGQRRIWRKNADLVATEDAAASTPALFDLFRRYQQSRHAESEMARMTADDLAAMIGLHTGHARLMTVFDARETLVGAMLYDALPDGESAVYSFFDPAYAAQSPGTWMILKRAALAAAQGKDYLYLGYWIAGSRKMSYKSRFRSLEVFRAGGWEDFSPPASGGSGVTSR
jgi:leucyl-tRNA---protein transferase